MVYLLDRSDFELGRDFCAAQVGTTAERSLILLPGIAFVKGHVLGNL
jgi:hypothetical protein